MELLKLTRRVGDELRRIGQDLADALVPAVCEVCGTKLIEGEDIMCLECSYKLPRCRIHTDDFNTIHQRMLRHVPIERAAAYFYYVRQSPYTSLILSAKYRGRPRIIRRLASSFAMEIKPDGFFESIDCIMPVAMHTLKHFRRGYNQTHHLALGLADVTNLPIAYNLKAIRGHATQTRKSAMERWINARTTYRVKNPESLAGKHILVVDDVITTGATITSCCEAIHKAVPSARISALSLGLTQLA